VKAAVALLITCAAGSLSAQGVPTTYAAVVAGKRCTENSRQQLHCDYRVGKSLHFSITAVGQPDAGISFLRADAEGDYSVRFGVQHGCVIVQRGAQLVTDSTARIEDDYAFVSPKNGKVYRTWEECRASR
jgi:hypothetical protein